MLTALNFFTVLIYGVLIMAFFLDIRLSRRNLLSLSGYVVFSALLQLVLYQAFGARFIEKSYPIVIHLPLLLFFWVFFKKRFVSVLFVLFTAYIFTVPRRWIGTLVSSLFQNDLHVFVIAQIAASAALLAVVYVYLRPFVNRILDYSGAPIILLTVMPCLFYLITYATTVYTETLIRSNAIVVGMVGVGLNFCFYVFLMVYFNEMSKSHASQTEQALLQLQVDATTMQIEDYKNAQDQAAIYRHDLRHHLNYLSACIADRHLEEAFAYISRISSDMETARVVQYCENKAVNLLLSAYVAQANKSGTDIEIHAVVPAVISVHAADVCVILGNGIENAIRACGKLEHTRDRQITVDCRHEHNKLLIEICNPFTGEVRFEDGLPLSADKDHGFGTKSIKAAAQKYRGLYSFTAQDGVFTLRVILQ